MTVGRHRVGGVADIEGLELYHADGVSTDFPRTVHQAWEIGMCSGGTARLIHEEGESLLVPGTLFVIPPGSAHSVVDPEEHAFCTLRISTDLINRLLGKPLDPFASPIVEHPSDARVTWCWLCSQLLADQPPAIYRSALVGAMQAILERMRKTEPVRLALPERVEAMRAQLQENLANQVSLKELGKQVELSQFHAARLFKAGVGVSPHKYQILLRIAEAKRLLVSGKSVTKVATLVGFADQSHLHRYFKRFVHVTPGDYRRWTGADSKMVQAEIRDRVGSFYREQSLCSHAEADSAE